MSTTRRFFLVMLLGAMFPRPGAARASARGCAAQGDARSDHGRVLERLKDRDTAPAATDPAITLAAILAPGDHAHRWKSGQGAAIAGYVYDVRPGRPGTANCRARGFESRDTQIVVVPDPMDERPRQRVIAVVTPGWRAKMAAEGIDWSTGALRRDLEGRWVRITGWMFFDARRGASSENTLPGRGRNRRTTPWEILPVTGIVVLPHWPAF